MILASIRLITADVSRLVGFYEAVTGLAAIRHTPDFAEIVTPGGTLAIGHARTLAPFGGDVARPAANHSAIIEFRVADVDAEHARIAEAVGGEPVQAPTTMPWGNRSALLRDPDGTLVNLYTPVTEAAIRRFAR